MVFTFKKKNVFTCFLTIGEYARTRLRKRTKNQHIPNWPSVGELADLSESVLADRTQYRDLCLWLDRTKVSGIGGYTDLIEHDKWWNSRGTGYGCCTQQQQQQRQRRKNDDRIIQCAVGLNVHVRVRFWFSLYICLHIFIYNNKLCEWCPLKV